MIKEILIDDLDGSEATETIPFGIDGDLYEIDLSLGNAEELRTLLARYAKVARPTRKASGKPQSRTPASSAAKKVSRPVKRQTKRGVPTPSEVRAWAKDNGIDVNSTGRVPKSLIADFVAARGK